jgi:hypothetical protein
MSQPEGKRGTKDEGAPKAGPGTGTEASQGEANSAQQQAPLAPVSVSEPPLHQAFTAAQQFLREQRRQLIMDYQAAYDCRLIVMTGRTGRLQDQRFVRVACSQA